MHQGNHPRPRGREEAVRAHQGREDRHDDHRRFRRHAQQRPMWNNDADENGDLWFFTKLHSPKTARSARTTQINLAYSDPSSQNYVSRWRKGGDCPRPVDHRREVE